MRNNLVRYQIKSSWYYIFWAIMTVAVVSGQIYVGTSYNSMSKSIEKLIDSAVIFK